MKGKAQTNVDGVNVLVETETSNNRHISYLNFQVDCEILTDEQVKEAYLKLNASPSIEDMKNYLMKVEGFASSNCVGTGGLDYQSLVSFKRV